MEKLFSEPCLSPKIELTQEEYNNLVELAGASAERIDERALEIYKKNGICEMDINVRIDKRVDKWSSGDDVEDFKYVFKPYWMRMKETVDTPHPFTIDDEMKKKIIKTAESIGENAFYYMFGNHLMELNNIMDMKRQFARTRRNFIITTVLGWAVAAVLAAVSIFG